MSHSWGEFTDADEVHRRAAGRRRYHAWRRTVRDLRRFRVLELLKVHGLGQRGTVTAIAQALQVSARTINRDLRYLLAEHGRCEACGQLRPVQPGAPEVVADVLAQCKAEGAPWAARGKLPKNNGCQPNGAHHE
jgi:hypothetical protein